MDVWCSCEDRLDAEAGYVHISFLRSKDVFWSPQMQGRGNFWPGIIEPLTTWQSQVGRHPQGSSSPTPTSGSTQNHSKIRHCVWECCPNVSRHFYYSSCSFRPFHLKITDFSWAMGIFLREMAFLCESVSVCSSMSPLFIILVIDLRWLQKKKGTWVKMTL